MTLGQFMEVDEQIRVFAKAYAVNPQASKVHSNITLVQDKNKRTITYQIVVQEGVVGVQLLKSATPLSAAHAFFNAIYLDSDSKNRKESPEEIKLAKWIIKKLIFDDQGIKGEVAARTLNEVAARTLNEVAARTLNKVSCEDIVAFHKAGWCLSQERAREVFPDLSSDRLSYLLEKADTTTAALYLNGFLSGKEMVTGAGEKDEKNKYDVICTAIKPLIEHNPQRVLELYNWLMEYKRPRYLVSLVCKLDDKTRVALLSKMEAKTVRDTLELSPKRASTIFKAAITTVRTVIPFHEILSHEADSPCAATAQGSVTKEEPPGGDILMREMAKGNITSAAEKLNHKSAPEATWRAEFTEPKERSAPLSEQEELYVIDHRAEGIFSRCHPCVAAEILLQCSSEQDFKDLLLCHVEYADVFDEMMFLLRPPESRTTEIDVADVFDQLVKKEPTIAKEIAGCIDISAAAQLFAKVVKKDDAKALLKKRQEVYAVVMLDVYHEDLTVIFNVIGYRPGVERSKQKDAFDRMKVVFEATEQLDIKAKIASNMNFDDLFELTRKLNSTQLGNLLPVLKEDVAVMIINHEHFFSLRVSELLSVAAKRQEIPPLIPPLLAQMQPKKLFDGLMMLETGKRQQCFRLLDKKTQIEVIKVELNEEELIPFGVVTFASDDEILKLREVLDLRQKVRLCHVLDKNEKSALSAEIIRTFWGDKSNPIKIDFLFAVWKGSITAHIKEMPFTAELIQRIWQEVGVAYQMEDLASMLDLFPLERRMEFFSKLDVVGSRHLNCIAHMQTGDEVMQSLSAGQRACWREAVETQGSAARLEKGAFFSLCEKIGLENCISAISGRTFVQQADFVIRISGQDAANAANFLLKLWEENLKNGGVEDGKEMMGALLNYPAKDIAPIIAEIPFPEEALLPEIIMEVIRQADADTLRQILKGIEPGAKVVKIFSYALDSGDAELRGSSQLT